MCNDRWLQATNPMMGITTTLAILKFTAEILDDVCETCAADCRPLHEGLPNCRNLWQQSGHRQPRTVRREGVGASNLDICAHTFSGMFSGTPSFQNSQEFFDSSFFQKAQRNYLGLPRIAVCDARSHAPHIVLLPARCREPRCCAQVQPFMSVPDGER